MEQKFAPIISVKEELRTLMNVNHRRLTPQEGESLGAPISLEELRVALRKGRRDTAPGKDGIGITFFKGIWDNAHGDLLELFTRMFSDGDITTQQKEGVIVCIPKKATPRQLRDYRPITLLNTDYKILARLIANRIAEVLEGLIRPSQHCGVRGKTIFEAASTVRDVIAYAEVTRKPLCVISIDFMEAFDRISHDYLFANLAGYGLGDRVVERIRSMYFDARSVIQINGHISAPFSVSCGVRQGCPLSMMLFSLCLDPLLVWLEDCLHGVRIRPGQRSAAVVAYADDVTVFATVPEDIEVLTQALGCYERATGAKVNIAKSKAMAVGRWDTARRIMDIPYCDELKILGFRFSATTERSREVSWARIVDTVRMKAREAYTRDLMLSQRIQYAHQYLMARLWHTAQLFPIPRDCVQRLMSAIACFLWRGAIFRVPLSTLHRSKEEGGWGLLEVAAKCRALHFARQWHQGQLEGSVTWALHRYWGLHRYRSNPPPFPVIPKSMSHLRQYALDLAYVVPPRQGEDRRKCQRRIYGVLRIMEMAGAAPQEMRIVTRHPTVDWNLVWRNLHLTWTSDTIKAMWYLVIHDLMPTNERLNRINLKATAVCDVCGALDTSMHRLLECQGGKEVWDETRRLLAAILRTSPNHIPPDWVLRPQFQIWPPKRHGAVLWLLAHMVWFRTKECRTLSAQDYMDFLRRARWKANQWPDKSNHVGNYLIVL
jgi:hypothetical protein